jgi:hypothetical protein
MPPFSGGNRIFHAFDALTKFESYLIKERIGRGFKPRSTGRTGGRPRRLDEKKIKT